uniref:Chaperonin GroEL n=1 Tax=uncultured virus TaxID=340016 RepID=A0A219YK71_9VIRU|nr:chaperonin GroEL [uncultured virus]
MSKIIETGSDSRAKLLSGVNQLANAVVTTLGPNGRNVVIAQQGGNLPASTKDGVTVAKTVTLKDPVENLGAQMVKQASIKTADNAGDGTTTATLLAKELISEGMNHLSQKHNAVAIKRGMDKTAKEIVKHLKEMSTDISSEEQIKQVATISANNDEEVGNLIAAAIDKVGLEGVVTVEESKSYETTLETVEGMQFDRGYKSPYFVTDNSTMQAQLDDPYILLYDGKISQVKELLPILEGVSQQNKSMLIIAEDIDGEALAAMIVNKMRGILKCCAVKAPDFGERRTHILEDIATLTGGTVISKQKGMRLDKATFDQLGTCRGVTVEKEKTTIVDGNGTEEAITARLEEVKDQIERAESNYAVEQLQNRLAKMAGGVAVINVGGFTETEMKERKDRVDDALHATRAALDEGIVPGGGVALLRAKHMLCEANQLVCEGDETIGSNILLSAIEKPFIQILLNAGIEKYHNILSSVEGSFENLDKENYGYNIKTGEYIDMVKEGIIDPTKVTRTALENAVSVAGTMLITECTIVDDPEDDKEVDPMSMMGM